MEPEITKTTSAQISLLASAATPQEAEAVVKQILAHLGYEAVVTEGGEHDHAGSSAEICFHPTAAPSWSIVLREAPSSPVEDSSDRESLARLVCEAFGLVVMGLEASSRIEALTGRLQDAISSIHHDIRTPLTSIAGMAQTLRMRPSVAQEVQTEFLERMEASADTITAMTDEFRASLDAMLSVAAVPAEVVRLDEIFEKAIEKLRSKGADVITVTEPQRPLFVRAPSGLIADTVSAVFAHFASILTGKAAVGLREESASGSDPLPSERTVRMILKGPVAAGHSIPSDLSKMWVPQGTLLADDQAEILSRPYHALRALGGTLDIYEEGGEMVFEITLPLSG
jgi:hypothetical protein